MQNTEITDECWLWRGYIDFQGYGVMGICNKREYAQRVSYRLFVEEPKCSLVLDHLCEVKSCVNPFHLEEVTSGENARRAVINKFGTETHCPKGHLWSIDNTGYQLNKSTGHRQRKCRKCNVISACAWRDKKRLLTYSRGYANIEAD